MGLSEIVQFILTYDGPVLGTILLATIMYARRQNRFQRIVDDIGEVRRAIDDQKHEQNESLAATLAHFEELKASLTEQTNAIVRFRASANISEHLDVLEKVFLVSEHMDKLKGGVTQGLLAFLDKEKVTHPEKAREAHALFKNQMELTRKSLEKTVDEKLGHALREKERKELTAAIINSVRHALLSVSKYHSDSVQAFAKSMLELLETHLREAGAAIEGKIDEIKKRLDEAPLLLAGTPQPKEKAQA